MKKKTKKKTTITSVFYTSYIGEYVQIVTKISPNIVVEGFILEIEDEYVHLSDDGMNIVRSIQRSDIGAIEIVKVKTTYDDILDRTPMPDKRENGN